MLREVVTTVTTVIKMPYEYRKLTPKQREEMVEHRKALGYPLHAPPHPYRDKGYYLLTAANYNHAAVMQSPERRTEFETRLLKAMDEVEAHIAGWAILANHYHILVGVQSLDHISAALKQLHGSTSYEWNRADGLSGKRKVWYKFADRVIRDDGHYFRALNYIHSGVMHLIEGSPKIRGAGYARTPYFRYLFANCVSPTTITRSGTDM
jgi:putative transposase